MTIHPRFALLLLIASLLAALAWLWVDAEGRLRNITWLAPDAHLPNLSSLTSSSVVIDDAPSDSVLARPLFSSDRRPPPPPVPPAPPPPPDPFANTQIVGMISGSLPGVLARVDGKIQRITINASIGSWKLQSVREREASFSNGSETKVLRLSYAKLGGTPRAAAPTANLATPPPVGNPMPNAAPPSAALPAGGAIGPAPDMLRKAQDETREILRRRNELRAANGLPPLPE